MSTIAKLAVEVGLDSGPLDKGLKDTREKVDKEGRNWTETFKNTGQKFTLGVTTPIVAGFGMMISMASDTSESMSAVETVYGDASTAIIDASKMSAKAMGISQAEYLAGASTLGVFAASAGLTGDAMSSFSTDLIGASADLASFYNANQPEVMDALKSGLMGEAEPLRKYGILLSDAAVNQYAWTHGIAETGQELTDQQKVASRYGYIMEGMGAASGDFARTSGGVANQLRILKARAKDVAAQFGKYLLPLTLKWAKGAGVLIKWVEGLSDSQKKLVLILGVVAAAIGPVLIGLSMMIPAITVLLGPVGLVIAALAALGVAYKTNFLGFGDLVNTAVGKIANFVSKIVMIGKAMKDAFMEGKPISELVKQFPGPLQSVAEKALKVADAFGDIYSRFKSGGFSAMMDILPSKLKAAGSAALGLGKDLLNGIKGAIEGVNWDTAGEDLGAGARKLAISLGKGFWENKSEIGKWVIKAVLAIPALQKYIIPKAYEFVKGFVRGLDINWPLIWGWLKKMPDKLKTALGNLLPVLVQQGRDLLSGLKNGIEARWPQVSAWLSGVKDRVVSAIGNALGSLVQQGKDFITGLSTGLHNRWISLRTWIASIPDMVVSAIGAVASKLIEKGKDFIGGLAAGAVIKWVDLLAWLKTLPQGVMDGIGDLSMVLWNAGVALMGGLWNGMKSKWEDIKHWLSSLNPADWKGPPERDKKMLINAGQLIMQGLSVGLDKGWQSVTNQLRGYQPMIGGAGYGTPSAGMAYSASASTVASMSGGGRGLTWTGDIIVQGYNRDPRELTNEIANTLSREFSLAGGFS